MSLRAVSFGVLGLAALLAPAAAFADAAPAAPDSPDAGVLPGPPPAVAPSHAPDGTLEGYRTPFETLTERAIGTTSRPVRFDWRKAKVEVGGMASQLAELNNFWSWRFGGFIRRPTSGLLVELAVTRVETWSTDSSTKLSQTPYRQYGRPNRLELDFNLGLPLAEGAVTFWPRYFPAAELVFSATGGFRYLLYTDAFGGAKFKDVAGAIFSPTLSTLEQNNLLQSRPPGMQVDEARYGLLVGFTTDLYFQSGFFVSPRVLMAVPLLQPVTHTQLGFWWELTTSVGWAF